MWNNSFRRPVIRQWRAVIPEKQEANKESPTTDLAYCLREFPLWCGEGEHRQNPEDSMSWGNGAGGRKPRKVEFAWENTGAGRPAGRKLWRSAEGPLQVYWSAHACDYPKPRKEPSKCIRGNGTQHSHRAGNSTCTHQLGWNTSCFVEHLVEYTKGACLSSGAQLTLKQVQLCSYLANLKSNGWIVFSGLTFRG